MDRGAPVDQADVAIEFDERLRRGVAVQDPVRHVRRGLVRPRDRPLRRRP